MGRRSRSKSSAPTRAIVSPASRLGSKRWSQAASTGFWSVLTDTGSYETHITRENGEILVEVAGERFAFSIGNIGLLGGLGAEAAGAGTTKRASARREVKAPMPGKVVKLLVGSGDTVSSGQGVLLFEAMKMHNEIKSPQDGVVGEMAVDEGQAVEARDRLFVIHSTK